jgi:hypothetical protein
MRAMIWLAVATVGAGLVTACNETTKPRIENLAPTAEFSVQCPALRCDFEDQSTDDGDIVSRSWNFGTEGSPLRNPFYTYSEPGNYPVTLTVTDNDGVSSSKTKNANPKAPAVTSLQCANGTAPGGFVACTLKLQQEAGFKVVLNASSCEAHGNIFRTTIPVSGTLTEDGCYEQIGKQLVFAGPFAAGTEIAAEMVAPMLAQPPTLVVAGEYPVWTLTYEDGADADFNDMHLTLTALPTP